MTVYCLKTKVKEPYEAHKKRNVAAEEGNSPKYAQRRTVWPVSLAMRFCRATSHSARLLLPTSTAWQPARARRPRSALAKHHTTPTALWHLPNLTVYSLVANCQ